MSEETKQEKKVSIINQGVAPMHTEGGILAPNQSVEVSEETAAKLCRAYPHIKRASDVVPVSKDAAAENAALKAQLKAVEKQLADSEGKNGDLTGRLQEFLDAGSKKDLDALKEKHADAVPAKETAGAAA